ncbi:uncharacterized protein TRAVEDRAFT_41863 [Trametes versicolor FP-101664 SS1]|uniref:uncharacterized protein n=1 Tax=Trametes versicolor (strain FP-101664) TaxID=717944 RepID=UPI000462322B|nr:uncharacterized protein TRAVEDRAFT_41863 [Trametes versicolor FP-101664 SS1]EIW64451.1 hypothetical protein TRAVEDRAFT_41863 [Trametes versicolor FP-101664 SS1]
MVRILQSSGTRLVRRGACLVQGLRQKSSWFVHNIITARPEVPARADPKFRRRHPGTTRPNELGQLQVMVATQEGCTVEQQVCSAIPDEVEGGAPVPNSQAGGKTLKSVRKLKRIGGRAVVALNVVDDEYGSESEDFGRAYSPVGEDSFALSEYHTAISHMTSLSGLGSAAVPQFVDESSGAVFIGIAMGPEARCYPTAGSIAGKYQTLQASVPALPITEASPGLLAAPSQLPSLMLTLPTPQIAQSPVFRPRSPITLFKYVEATTPTRDSNPLSFPAIATPSPAPSIPACDRCCLAQLEDGVICRSCEKQWLACKMWYQAHDGGRRRWLTEPYINPAESTASIRAVMGRLGAPANSERPHSTRGLGLGSSVSFQQELPFRVLASSSVASVSLVHSHSAGTGSWATRLGYQIAAAKRVASARRGSLAWTAARKTQAGLRALWSVSLGLLLPGPLSRDLRPSAPSSTMSDDSLGTSSADSIGGHRRPSSSMDSSSLRFGTLGLGCITSRSRFVEHLF